MTEDKLKEDFRVFLWLLWKHIDLPDPTPMQYDIAKFLQHGPNKISIQAFRGIGKSFITSAFGLWLLYKDAQLKIMVVSASKNRADNFVKFTKQLIETVPELAHLKPRQDQRNSNIEFDVGPALPDQSPSLFAKGIDSQLAGGRADIIISDDVEVYNNSFTMQMRDKLQEKTKEYSAILKPLPTSRIIYLGTPQTEDSIYNKLPETFTTRIWPALVPTSKELVNYLGTLAPKIKEMVSKGLSGTPTDPQRFDEDELIARRAEYGSSGFALQFMLNCKLSDEEKYPLKLKNLCVMSVPPEKAPFEVNWLPNTDRELKDLPNNGMAGDKLYSVAGHGYEFSEYQHRVMSIDPSGRGADETAYSVGFHLGGNIWVPEMGGLRGGYEDSTLETLVKIAKKHKVKTFVIESNFGDGMFASLLRPVMNKHKLMAEIVEVRHSTMKERRILDTLEPVVGSHKLIVDPDVFTKDQESIQKYDQGIRMHKGLFHQMTRICREKGALRHDDRIDALAIMVAHFVELMTQDSSKLAQEQQQDAHDKWMATFHKDDIVTWGDPSKGKTNKWVQRV